MKERPVSEITPPQGKAVGRERPNEDETRVRHEERSGKENAAIFFLGGSWNEKERCLQETYRRHSRCNEAGASFNTDPSSDERQMHLNVVKCSN
ncbi:hypothetical protein TNCV_89511 [Trichonephila clavipes]|nr:hypothetical protein TNCV_89511 [Trichonephila clavipes]